MLEESSKHLGTAVEVATKAGCLFVQSLRKSVCLKADLSVLAFDRSIVQSDETKLLVLGFCPMIYMSLQNKSMFPLNNKKRRT